MHPLRFATVALVLLVSTVRGAVPVVVTPVVGRQGMVVAAHPQAAEIGVAVLKAGGNAIDAAVATSLALGVAEPYGSGLGGKLMLLYHDAASGRTHAVDAMDAAGSVDVAAYVERPVEDRSYGYPAVSVPGLGAGLWAAHQRWGRLPWADTVRPAMELARSGFRILPKTRDLMAEQEGKLRRGDAEIARLYLPGGSLPEVGSLLPNADLARTLERFAEKGRDGFYRGPVAEAIVSAARAGGGAIALADLAGYEPRVSEPMTAGYLGYTLQCGPPPVSGALLFLTIMKVLEPEPLDGGPLRSASNLDRIGRVWRLVAPQVSRTIGDMPHSRFLFEKLIAPDSIAELREKAFAPPAAAPKAAGWFGSEADEHGMAATTHFVVADAAGNIVSATQSQSHHFGAGVVPPGTGVVMNNSMSNFNFTDPANINHLAPGKRSRSTISPTIVLRNGRPVLALGLPGASRIPTAMLQVLIDRLALNRPLDEAIGDTRVHYSPAGQSEQGDAFEAEESFPAEEAREMQARGWRVVYPEPAGTGRYFGGINAVEFNPDGSMSGYADPRRTSVAVGY